MNGGSIAGSPAAVQAAPASSDGRAGAYRACRSGRPVHAAPRPKALGPVAPRHPLAFLVGSGFDAADPLSAQLTCTVLEGAAAAVLVDGGGLDALTSPEGRLLLRRRFIDGLPTVITPHAGEAARLAAPLALPTDDPAQLALLLSQAYGVTAMVKGPLPIYLTVKPSCACRMEPLPWQRRERAMLSRHGRGAACAGLGPR